MIIFYVHKGCQEYLMASIKQIQSRIPNVDIVLLGDQSNNDISGISGVIMDDYADFAEKFKENYQHFSPNDYDYELFCIQRWFYIYAYMIKNEINHAIYIDSDVLLNCLPENIDTTKYYYCFNSGHTSIFSIETLEEICNYISYLYSDKEKIEWLKSILERRQEEGLPGGVSDMTLLLSYVYNNSDKAVDLSRVKHLKVFDHNIQEDDDFELYKGCKAIYYIAGKYYFKDNLTGHLIEAGSMHFQGDAKVYMSAVIRVPTGESTFLFDYEKKKWIKYDERDHIYEKSKTMKLRELIYKVFKKIEQFRAFRK